MKTFTEKAIDRTWKRVHDATPEEGQRMMEELTGQQPFLVAYLLAVEETFLTEDERGNLMLMGLIIWELFSKAGGALRKIGRKELEAVESANVKFLEDLDAGSEIDYLDAMQKLMASYNQMPLLGAVIEALMDGNEDEPELAPEDIGVALLHMKTVIDCLDQ